MPEEPVVEPTPPPYVDPNARVIYRLQDGGVGVLIPAPDCGLTIEDIIAKDVPSGVPYAVVDASQLPAERDFRGAWEYATNGLAVSLPKAREITKSRLRSERAPLLAAQDVAFQRALEEGQSTALVASEKQRLRDITKRADQANTLDELRGIRC